jgi:hypothetical protein
LPTRLKCSFGPGLISYRGGAVGAEKVQLTQTEYFLILSNRKREAKKEFYEEGKELSEENIDARINILKAQENL